MDRKSDELENPLMKSLYCGQILYNVVSVYFMPVRLKKLTHGLPPRRSYDR